MVAQLMNKVRQQRHHTSKAGNEALALPPLHANIVHDWASMPFPIAQHASMALIRNSSSQRPLRAPLQNKKCCSRRYTQRNKTTAQAPGSQIKSNNTLQRKLAPKCSMSHTIPQLQSIFSRINAIGRKTVGFLLRGRERKTFHRMEKPSASRLSGATIILVTCSIPTDDEEEEGGTGRARVLWRGVGSSGQGLVSQHAGFEVGRLVGWGNLRLGAVVFFCMAGRMGRI
jgi:hypothetical protein